MPSISLSPADEHLRYPIGRLRLPEVPLTPAQRTGYIDQIAALPTQLTATARAVGGVRLQLSYRPNGWTGRAVIHHVADAHTQIYGRFRLALTEDAPVIKAYDEVAWAALPDVEATPITVSLALLEALHARFVILLHHMAAMDWARTYHHPKQQRTYTLDEGLVACAWHGQHHLAHVALLAYGVGRRKSGLSQPLPEALHQPVSAEGRTLPVC
ncbi:MAG: putative metal-dependent hydrolase [Hymenobacteraceae bacterium]|nr:putative metal-dependent hydrolase [Hymenobacteraceae bacterium]